jgi:NADH-quinone oxidoreductase subunit L
VSQLGYMFLAMGVGAFGAGIFHLYTHAFFKACLFLGSGAVIHALHGEQDIRHMGGLKRHLPITFWTFLVASIAIAGIPGLAGFFSKDEILFETFDHGHQVLWGMGVVTSLLTATYMFRLVFLTFYGERRHAPAAVEAHGHTTPPAAPSPAHTGFGAAGAHGDHGGHLHDAPPAMALALIVLAVGSVLAGYIGIPHALGGHNTLGEWLRPSFTATARALAECNVPVSLPGAPAGMTLAECLPGDAVPAVASSAQTAAERAAPAALGAGAEVAGAAQPAAEHAPAGAEDKTALELALMGVSSVIALLGIGLAAFLWLRNPAVPERLAAQFPGLHRLLLNKYYVDELYDAAIVHPIQSASTHGLWKVVDARMIDGAVNVSGYVVAAASAVLRLFQTGSVRSYAASTFVGVVLILGYYLWR